MKYAVIALLAATALFLFFYFRKPKPVQQQQQQEPLDPTGEGFHMGGGGSAGFMPGDITGLFIPQQPQVLIVPPAVKNFAPVATKFLGKPVKQIAKPVPGTTQLPGTTATIGANPNKPIFT